MLWLSRDVWKAGIVLAGMLLLLVLMVWVPVSAAGAYEGVLGLTTPGTGTVQVTPTDDATVTALNKEKLAQEVQQLKNQNAPDLFGWLRTNAAVLLSTLVVVIGGLIGLFRWLGDRRDEHRRKAHSVLAFLQTLLHTAVKGLLTGSVTIFIYLSYRCITTVDCSINARV